MNSLRAGLHTAVANVIVFGLVTTGCGANQPSNRDPLLPNPASTATSAASASPNASASPSVKPETKPPPKEIVTPANASTDAVLGVESEPAPEKPSEAGFGPPEGSSQEYGMVNLLAQPPSKARKRRAK